MDIEIRMSSVEAQVVFVRSDDNIGHVIQIGDVEFHELPEWVLKDLYNRIGQHLCLPAHQDAP